MKNNKTTIAGLLLAGLISAQTMLTDDFDINKQWIQLVVAVLVGALGWLANDPKTQNKDE